MPPSDQLAAPTTVPGAQPAAVPPGRPWLAVWFVAAMCLLLAVHVLEPELPLSWSYAGLRVAWGSVLPALGAGAVVLVVVALCWRLQLGTRPAQSPSVRAAVVWGFVVWAVLIVAGFRWPAPDVCPDAAFLPFQLQMHGPGNVRWLLSVPLLQALFSPFHGAVEPDVFLRVANAAFSALSIVLTVAIAFRLGRTVREVAAIVLLTWTALGSLQLAFGYVDIYPIVQVLVALYLWTAIRYLDGDGSVVWPLLVAAWGPCFYIGLILLGPSVLVLLYAAWQRGQLASVAVAVAIALALVGLSTVPTFGRVFAFPAWLHRLSNVGVYGLNPGRQTLPASYMFSVRHAGEVLSSILLLDGVGLILVAALPVRDRAAGTLLFLLLVAGLAFVIAMDPLWGPYSDWDLFSYLTLPLSLGAGMAFVAWSRRQPEAAGLVLGLALAVSTVHLFARLNTLHLDFARHIAASPIHIPGAAASGFEPSVRRSIP